MRSRKAYNYRYLQCLTQNIKDNVKQLLRQMIKENTEWSQNENSFIYFNHWQYV